MEEKRKFPRFNLPLEVIYSPKGTGVIYSRSISKNISKGGICIPVLSRLVRAGDDIKLEIYSKAMKNNPVPAKGRVVWMKETSGLSSVSVSPDGEAGIEFTEIDAFGIEKLIQAA